MCVIKSVANLIIVFIFYKKRYWQDEYFSRYKREKRVTFDIFSFQNHKRLLKISLALLNQLSIKFLETIPNCFSPTPDRLVLIFKILPHPNYQLSDSMGFGMVISSDRNQTFSCSSSGYLCGGSLTYLSNNSPQIPKILNNVNQCRVIGMSGWWRRTSFSTSDYPFLLFTDILPWKNLFLYQLIDHL